MVKDGYKLTDIGVIPEDWEVKKIGEIGEVVRGGSPRPAGDNRFFNGSYIPWLTVASLTNISKSQLLVDKTESFLTEEGSKRSRILSPKTLIISNSGATLGVAKILKLRCCANDGIAALINQKNGNKYFIAQYINTKTKYLHDVVASGNGQPNLNTSLIKELKLPFPPEKEQKAIAKALSDTDELIESLQKLIEKKEIIKTATMQQLLTGKKRLDGFSEKWEEKELSEFAIFYKGKGLPKSKIVDNAKYKCIHYGELFTKYKDVIKEVDSFTNEKIDMFISQENDVLMPTSDVTPKGLATASCINESGIVLGGDILVIRPNNDLDGNFLAYSITINKNQILQLVTGSTVYHLYGSDMARYRFKLPQSIKEQEKIVEILSDMDNEIEKLKIKLSKLKTIKEAMMDELLTGKTRLV